MFLSNLVLTGCSKNFVTLTFDNLVLTRMVTKILVDEIVIGEAANL